MGLSLQALMNNVESEESPHSIRRVHKEKKIFDINPNYIIRRALA